jgi:hypothetical protein
MIDTNTTIERMPRLLASFKKYIEKYVCTYEVSVKEGHQVYSLVFYEKKSKMAYLIVCVDDTSTYPIIYENKDADNWGKENCLVRPDNYISNDMNAFITEIRKCIETNPVKEVSPEVNEVMKAFPDGVKVI